MKKIMPIIIAIVFVLSTFNAVGNIFNIKSTIINSDSAESFVISISYPDFEIVENSGKHLIKMDGYKYLSEPGMPLLPAKTFLIALPPDTIVQSVDLIGLNMRQVPGFYEIKPASKVIPTCFDIEYDEYLGEIDKKTAEEHAQSELVQNLYPYADLFVNDAFAAAHRKQCSLIGFTAVLPSCAGRLMEKELTTLGKIIKNPKKPSVFLFGGAKFSDVIVTIERLLTNKTADKIILTGLPANAFLKAEGIDLGEKNKEMLSKEETPESYNEIKKLLAKHKDNIFLPLDFAIQDNTDRNEIDVTDLPTNFNLYDIGEKSIKNFKNILNDAKTVFLSGPCGVFENPLFMKGTKEIFTFVANIDVFSIVGGGHTVAAVEQLGLDSKISHISTGGGSLEKFMMGEKLPAVEALKEAKNKTF